MHDLTRKHMVGYLMRTFGITQGTLKVLVDSVSQSVVPPFSGDEALCLLYGSRRLAVTTDGEAGELRTATFDWATISDDDLEGQGEGE